MSSARAAPAARRPRVAPGIRRRGRLTRRGRLVRAALLALLALLVLQVPISYFRALTGPGTDSLSARTVEWIRDHGASGLVNAVENFWYSHHQPPIGGRPSQWPVAAASGSHELSPSASYALATAPQPPDIVPFAHPALPGEGVWRPLGRTVAGQPTMYVAYLRPDAEHTSLVVAAVWMDEQLVRMTLVGGLEQPGGGPWPWGGEVPPNQRSTLVATFNSGFRIQDSRGGFYADGRYAAPLVAGRASLVIFKDGSATVGLWGRDVSMTPNVVAVRQNLQLLVDDGRPTPASAASSSTLWGATLGNDLYVWRSGVGVTADGNLVYVTGPGMSVRTLADVLAAAHCVRAMELDINPYWTSFNSYLPARGAGPDAVVPTRLLADMERSPDRYLVPDTRDFVAVQLRSS